MGFVMSQCGFMWSVDWGISRGISPAWKKAWSDISSMEGRVVGSEDRREDISCFACSEMGLAVGKSY
jgi:hypothetical protein